MDYAKLLETLLPFLEKLLGAVTAAGHPGVGVSPVMGHLPGLHDELARLREHILAAALAQDKADAAAPKVKAQDKAAVAA